jgi:hypothetical protein
MPKNEEAPARQEIGTRAKSNQSLEALNDRETLTPSGLDSQTWTDHRETPQPVERWDVKHIDGLMCILCRGWWYPADLGAQLCEECTELIGGSE